MKRKRPIVTILVALVKDNPPAKEDAPMVTKITKIGIVLERDFDISKLDPAVTKILEAVRKAGFEKIMARSRRPTGWLTGGSLAERRNCTGPSISSGQLDGPVSGIEDHPRMVNIAAVGARSK